MADDPTYTLSMAETGSNDTSPKDTGVSKRICVKKIIEKAKAHRPVVKKLVNPYAEDYTEDELEYYRKQTSDSKKRIIRQENLMRKLLGSTTPTRFKLLLSEMDPASKAIAMRKLSYMDSMEESSGEYYKIKNWIDAVISIPFGKYKDLPVTYASPKSDIKTFLKSTRDRLDAKVYGHNDAKDHLVRMLAQWISNPESRGMVLGIQGAMGCGKTTLVKEGVCKALGLPFAFLPLGGASDGAYLEGHSYTYEGATWGKVVDTLMRSKSMNPVIFFDELDKVSTTQKGEEIINILIHLTDSSQNDKFHDKYFTDFDFDLSRCIIIFSYNDEELINPILKDRMVKIRTNGYKLQDKLEIAKKHMIPEILSEFNMSETAQVVFSDDIIKNIINVVEEEHGVRNMKRAIHDIISNINLNLLMCDTHIALPVIVNDKHITEYVAKSNKANDVSLLHMYM